MFEEEEEEEECVFGPVEYVRIDRSKLGKPRERMEGGEDTVD